MDVKHSSVRFREPSTVSVRCLNGGEKKKIVQRKSISIWLHTYVRLQGSRFFKWHIIKLFDRLRSN